MRSTDNLKSLPPELAPAVEAFDRAVHDALDNLSRMRRELVAELEQRAAALANLPKLEQLISGADCMWIGLVDVPADSAGPSSIHLDCQRGRWCVEIPRSIPGLGTPGNLWPSIGAGRHRIFAFAIPLADEGGST